MNRANPVSRRHELWYLGLAHCLVLSVLLFPVWLVDIFPAPDYLSHMARIYVLSALDSDPMLATMYEARWGFLPNLAMDIFILVAAKGFPLLVAGKLFISACIILWMGGAAWLHFALSRRWCFAPLLAALFVLNAPFFFGFLNYTFSAGVAILGLAAWVTMTSWRLLPRLVCFFPIAIIAYFSHIVGFAILAACVLGFECGRELEEARFSFARMLRRLLYATVPFVPLLLVYFFLTPHGAHDISTSFGDIWRSYARIKHATSLSFKTPYLLALLFVAVIGGIGLLTRTVAIDRRMWPVLLGLGLAALLVPVKILGGAFLDIRLPAVIGCLGVASMNVRISRAPQITIGVVLTGLLLYRAVVLSFAWTGYDRDYANLTEFMNSIEPGSKMFLALDEGETRADRYALTIYSHYLDLMGVQRNIFTPRVYAWLGQHPLRAKPGYWWLGAVSAYQGKPIETKDLLVLARGDHNTTAPRYPYLRNWQCHFDYVVVAHRAGMSNPAPTILDVQRTGRYFTLFKVNPTGKRCAQQVKPPIQ